MKCTGNSVGSDHEIGFFNQLPPGRFLADALSEKSSQELSDEIGDVIRIQAASRIVVRFNQHALRVASVFMRTYTRTDVLFSFELPAGLVSWIGKHYMSGDLGVLFTGKSSEIRNLPLMKNDQMVAMSRQRRIQQIARKQPVRIMIEHLDRAGTAVKIRLRSHPI